MHAAIIFTTGLLAALASALEYTQVIYNNCDTSQYFTYTSGSQAVNATTELPPAATYETTIGGSGNVWGITPDSNYYGDNKLLLGTSIGSDGNLYWTVSNDSSNALSTFDILPAPTQDSSDCVEVTGYDGGATHVCPTDNQVLTLTLC